MSAPCPVFGFVLRAIFEPSVARDQVEAFRDDLIELLEPNGLMTSGGGDRVLEYVITREGTQATDMDRRLVIDWARRWGKVATITVSDLADLNEVAR